MNKNLIIDIGMHKSEDTDFYLKNGFEVIAIDADPNLIQLAHFQYKSYVSSKQLKLLNYAISGKDGDEVTFNIGKKTVWNSIKKSITDRNKNQIYSITVKTKKLSTIIESFGVPYYCKIDIEGYDEIALNTLNNLNELPAFISVETECIGENEVLTDQDALATLRVLHTLGYTHFKLVDQVTLTVLNENQKFYTDRRLLFYQLFNKFNIPVGNRRRLQKQFKYKFPSGASGPFGEGTENNWMNYEQAEQALLMHRNDYFSFKRAVNYGFWCDWHASTPLSTVPSTPTPPSPSTGLPPVVAR